MNKWKTTIIGMVAVGYIAGCATLPGGSPAGEARELHTIHQVALACELFAADHDGAMPSNTADIAPYLGKQVDLSQVNLVAVGKRSAVKDPSTVVLLRSKVVSPTGKRAVAYVDGHCALLSE